IRLPASICGVSGIKGTQTRVSRYGAMPLSFSADNVGPLARTARDLARLMGIIAGHDPLDPTSAREPVPDYEARLTGDIKGMRIGVAASFFTDGAHAEVLAAFEAAIGQLEKAGAVIKRIPMPHMDAIATYSAIVSRCEGGAIHRTWMRERPGDYSIHLAARLYGGLAIPAAYYIEALARRGPILKAFAGEVFGAVDAFLAPTVRIKVPTLAETDIDADPKAIDSYNAISINTRVINYLGLPSVSVPCGLDTNRLPIGLMISGRPFGEGRILAVADTFQRLTDWHKLTPPHTA
ncbi:MAG: amidase, partial [Proteobacteria bacterium]|nr:amidase [Pseudomonadota bacterium]